MQLEVGWHRLLRKKSLHASRSTGKPRFLLEVPLAMMCGDMGDMVSPSFELLRNGCVLIFCGCKVCKAIDYFTEEFIKAIRRSSI